MADYGSKIKAGKKSGKRVGGESSGANKGSYGPSPKSGPKQGGQLPWDAFKSGHKNVSLKGKKF